MKMIKSVLIVVVLITSLFNVHGMEPELPKKGGWKNKFKSFFLGKSSTSFSLGEFPQEIQHEIIILIGQYNSAKSLKEAGQMIHALALTNKSLNDLMNEPQFCFELIRVLAQKFKTSDERAAKAIGTKEAQRQYYLQKKLYLYVCDEHWNRFKDKIKEACDEGADINFIYKSGKTKLGKKKSGETLLMHAAKALDVPLFNFLIKQGADINFANNKGVTALMVAAESALKYDLREDFQKLINMHKNFNINQQNLKGNTALMYALRITPINRDIIKILVDAGAYPELPNFDGISPLEYVKNLKKGWIIPEDMNPIIVLFEQAIPKK